MDRFTFPGWVDFLIRAAPVGAALGGLYVAALIWFCFSPKTTDVGYQPKQPVPFSHALHAGKLKMDCRYCHNTVETAAFAAVPPTGTCLNCHSPADESGQSPLTAVHVNSPKLAWVHRSAATGEPIPWQKVHDLPDYSYFNHSAHVSKGVSCVSCHGRIDKMEVVSQHEPLSMSWCLDCHRNPAPNLRPVELVTKLDWEPAGGLAERIQIGEEIRKKWDIPTNAGEGLFHPQVNHNTNCSTCHR